MGDTSTGTAWQQVNLWCDSWQAAEQMALAQLLPLFVEAEQSGTIACWWFVRKDAAWRLRLLPAARQEDAVAAFVDQSIRALAERGAIRGSSTVIYEPEAYAFGGKAAMDVAHIVFHADSRHILTHLACARADHRRELGLLLGSRLMRGAGQDWYEQGDIWARVAAHRAGRHPIEPQPALVTAAGRLLAAAVDAGDSPLRAAPGWPAAFREAGRDLAHLAQRGDLTRGLRAVLTHHVLFNLNRLGVPARQQHLLAAAAAAAIFDQPPHTPPPRPAATPPAAPLQ